MKTLTTLALFSTLAFSSVASAAKIGITAMTCDKVEIGHNYGTSLGMYVHELKISDEASVEPFEFSEDGLTISGTIRSKGNQHYVTATARYENYAPVKLMTRVFEEQRTVAGAGLCQTTEDVGTLNLNIVTMK